MIKIDYEVYRNDNNKHMENRAFDSLTDLEDWMFSLMQRDYTKDKYCMPFWEGEEYKKDPSKEYLYNGGLEVDPCYPSDKEYLIDQISRDGKILYSDGKLTANQKHCSKEIYEWLIRGYDRQMHPVFDFED